MIHLRQLEEFCGAILEGMVRSSDGVHFDPKWGHFLGSFFRGQGGLLSGLKNDLKIGMKNGSKIGMKNGFKMQ